jgi:hypothetical protein
MITEQAIQRTIKQLEKKMRWKNHFLLEMLKLILKNQGDIDEEEEKRHSEIINEIGQP